MTRIITSLFLSAVMLCAALPVHGYIYQYSTTNSVQVHWPIAPAGSVTTINIALSTSLSSPPANIKAGSDVLGAARRALRRWSEAARIQFVESSTSLDTVNTTGSDGVSLITVANNPTNAGFTSGRLGRTRVVFDAATGIIREGDLALSPSTPFSTDGTSGTYDLESTFVHELGHLLGLDHSTVIGSTMQPRQGQNFNAPAFTMRTLSEDDLAGIRNLYGQRIAFPVGAIAGHVNYGAGAHVWAENFHSGKVMGSSITNNDGNYRIDQLPPGDYRVVVEYLDEPVVAREITVSPPYSSIGNQPAFRPTESQASVAAGATSILNLTISVGAPSINPRILGINGALQGAPVQIEAGRTFNFTVGGNGLDLVPLTTTGFSFTSPNMVIDPTSFVRENPANYNITEPNYGIVSFTFRVVDTAKWGEYTLRVRTDAGEVAFLSGALAIDPYTNFAEANPLQNNGFFVRQQYLDFLFREPDQSGFDAWVGVLNRCDAAPSPECDRVTVSSSFFRSQEFQLKGYFVYRFYKLTLLRLPTYAEMIPDMISVTGATASEVFQKRAAFANNWVQRPAFAQLNALPPADFVNTLMNRYNLQTINTPDPHNPDTGGKVVFTRDSLIAALNAGSLTRAQVVRAIVESDELFNAEFNPAFVAMQYFGYLKRDPDAGGYNAWLNYLNANPTDFRTMVNGFVNSNEYRSRFGQP
jgi:hypothetical protein